MTGNPILPGFLLFGNRSQLNRPDLHTLWLHLDRLPKFVTDTPAALRILDLLGPLDWARFPERDLQRNWGHTTVPYAAFAAACLVKLNEGLVSMADLRQYLVEHPSFIWLCGFPLQASLHAPGGFDAEASLPTQRHLTHMLRAIPNAALQFLLADSVRLILAELRQLGIQAGDCISLDTKHVIAWVKENNPKAYVEDRYDKTKQPPGDKDCRLGCKRRHNRKAKRPLGQEPSHSAQPPGKTPAHNPVPASKAKVGEFYWGYGSGVVVIKVPGWGEFVLAEMTQPFDQPDVSYFFPLMGQAVQRLGFKPRFGTFDAAFDAWYVYAYFHREDDPQAFAAVPFSEKGGYKAKGRQFSPDGLPLCTAGLPMPLKFAYTDRTVCIVEHQRGKYVCPLRFPQRSAKACPVKHKNWPKGGCSVAMPLSIGARLRYTLDRDSEAYKQVYRQRTAVERINSQAVALGIERPHWRNGQAIANLNTLIYILINLRMLQRIRQRKPETD
jgi:hypothetical protein